MKSTKRRKVLPIAPTVRLGVFTEGNKGNEEEITKLSPETKSIGTEQRRTFSFLRYTRLAPNRAKRVGRVTPCAPGLMDLERRARSDAPYLSVRRFLTRIGDMNRIENENEDDSKNGSWSPSISENPDT